MRNPIGTIAKLGQSTARLLARYGRDVRGVTSIEVAFIFPVMLIIYFGLVDASNLLSASRRVTLTASTLADLTTQAPATITKAELDGFFNAASAIMDPFPASEIALEVFGYTKDGSNAKLDWSYKNETASCGAASARGWATPSSSWTTATCWSWTRKKPASPSAWPPA